MTVVSSADTRPMMTVAISDAAPDGSRRVQIIVTTKHVWEWVISPHAEECPAAFLMRLEQLAQALAQPDQATPPHQT